MAQDGIIEVNDNTLRYMTATSGGWQPFQPTEQETGGYGRAHIDQAYGIVDWIEGKVRGGLAAAPSMAGATLEI